MKKIITFLMAVLLLMSVCIINPVAEGKTTQMLVFGDSISTGYGLESYSPADPYKCASYANIIAKKLKLEGGSTYINKAVNGDTSSDLLALLPSLESDLKQSDIIIISIGGNDLLSTIPTIASSVVGRNITDFSEAFSILSVLTSEQYSAIMQSADVAEKINSTLNEFSSNINEIASKINLSSPNARVVFLKQYNPMKGVQGLAALGNFAQDMINTINSAVENACKTAGFETADIPSVIDADPEKLTNILKYDIHPNAKGHAEIASLLAEQLGISLDSTESTTYSDNHLPEGTEPTVENPEQTANNSSETTKNESGCSSEISGISFIIALPAVAFTLKRKND